MTQVICRNSDYSFVYRLKCINKIMSIQYTNECKRMSIYSREKQKKHAIRNFTCKPCFRAANGFASVLTGHYCRLYSYMFFNTSRQEEKLLALLMLECCTSYKVKPLYVWIKIRTVRLEQGFANGLFCHARNLISFLKLAKDIKCSFPKLITENRHNEIGTKADHGMGGCWRVMAGISKFSSVILLGIRRNNSLFADQTARFWLNCEHK